jgi:glycosyltransferase involved in cell wall biosynthesis
LNSEKAQLPLVSVIIPNYNHAKYIGQRFKSIIGQSYANMEIIIIDDCSTDGSRSIIKNFSGGFRIRKIFNESTLGPFCSHNLAARIVEGEYILFAESDDYSDRQLVETLMEGMLRDSKVSVAFCRSKLIDEIGTILCEDYELRETAFKERCLHSTYLLGKEMRKFLLISNVIPNMSAALIKKKMFLDVGGLDNSYRLCADWDLWLKFCDTGDFYYSEQPLNYFRMHKCTTRELHRYDLEMMETYNLIINACNQKRLSFKNLQRVKNNLAYNWISKVIRNPSRSIKSFREVWRKAWPFDRLVFVRFFFVFIKKFLFYWVYYGKRPRLP